MCLDLLEMKVGKAPDYGVKSPVFHRFHDDFIIRVNVSGNFLHTITL